MFLAVDVFFALFCIMLAFIIGVALLCPVAGQKGASDAELRILRKSRFRSAARQGKLDLEKQHAFLLTIYEPSTREFLDELSLSPEDSKCCLCLTWYEEGIGLASLPCDHHFHSSCIVKWLYFNATCPLCKYNIKGVANKQA